MTIKNRGRYFVPSDEDIEPESNGEVLNNYLGIKSRETIELAEEQELERAESELLTIFNKNHRFSAEDICNIHELWLGDIYPSAGKYRTVTMSKNGFPFANPSLIPKLMDSFEANYLKKYAPCHHSDLGEVAYAIGVVHIELIVIHPFREGNGRTARLLTNLMASQSNIPLLDFNYIDQIENTENFQKYIYAIQVGDYDLMQNIFQTILEQSLI